MRRFFKLVSISMQENLHFRLAFLLNLATPFVLLLGQYMLWNSLYKLNNGQSIGTYSQKTMYTYILLSFFITNLLTWRSENTISRKIISGSIVTDVVRPFPFLLQNIADMTGPMLLQASVNLCIVGVVFLLSFKYFILSSPIAFTLAIISMVLGLLLRLLLVSTFSLLCFYTTSHLGLSWTRTALMEFFSGAVVPVALFPELLRKITYFTPFPYMLQTPISIYLDHDTFFSIPICFAVQVAWIVVFVLLQTFFWGHIRKNITVAGG
jgi:ABC-2 type transport system permease protein